MGGLKWHSRRIDRRLIDNLWRIMGERRMTQTDVARAIGTNTNTFSHMMNGRNGISVPTLRRIKDALDVSWEELLD